MSSRFSMRSDILLSKKPTHRDSESDGELGDRIDKELDGLDAGQRLDLRLRLAARLCEDGAYGAAGIWPAEKIATAVLLAAQIERLLRHDNG